MRARLIVAIVVVFALSYGVATLWRRVHSDSEPTRPHVPKATRKEQQPVPGQPGKAAERAAEKPVLKEFEVARTTTRSDLAGETRVVIGNPYGHVTVEPGGPQVEVLKVVYARGPSETEARGKTKAFRVTTKQDKKEGLTVEVAGDPKNYDVGVNLTVRVPPTVTITARSGAGSVRVGDMRGSVTAEGSKGDVVLGHVKGKVTASTSSGKIEVQAAEGGLEARTSSGDLDLRDIKGDSVIARSMGGAIALRVISAGKVVATTMSGPVDLVIRQPFSGEAEVRSSSGDLLVSLPAASNCKVRTATGSGPIKCSLPLKEEKHEGTNVSGRLGAGKGTFLVTNDTGAIDLRPTK